MNFEIESTLKDRFPGLNVLLGHISEVTVKKSSEELQKVKADVCKQVQEKYTIEFLKDVPIFRAYRDFFWKVGVDPTKIRPAAEALIRRIVAGKPIPTINNVVDSYNLASIQSGVALAAFDSAVLQGDLLMRTADTGETFLGIGMRDPMELHGGEIVVSDKETLIAVYPYRDAEKSKVSDKTRQVLILVCGVPGLDEKVLEEAGEIAITYITRFCGGNGELDRD